MGMHGRETQAPSFPVASPTEPGALFPPSPGKWVSAIHTSVLKSPPQMLSSQQLDGVRVLMRGWGLGEGM